MFILFPSATQVSLTTTKEKCREKMHNFYIAIYMDYKYGNYTAAAQINVHSLADQYNQNVERTTYKTSLKFAELFTEFRF